jgi:sigma-B regulation protein RsbU (phosphoserine phosphatase)
MEADLESSIENLKKTTSAKQRMESELNIGREIQMSMLPLIFPAYPERPEFSVHADLHPAREVGGDFYDFFFVTDDLFCFCIGDVSDKGVPAALLMAVTKTLLKSRAADDFSPASVLSHVNDEVSRENKACMFVTVFLGILNVKTGELVYANAGHNPPYLIRDDHSVERLGEPHGVVIGAVEGLAYQEGHNKLSSGDILLTYTDGVTEAMNVAGDLFSEKRLVDLLSSRNYESSEDVVHSIVRAVRLFERGADQADDITVMSIAFLGPQEGVEVDGFGIKIKNRPADIQRIVSRFSDFCEKHTIAESVRRQVSLVFDELLNNTISYAYKDEEVHDIEIGVELSRDRLTIRISDDGIPFNPFGLQDPDTSLSLEDREVGGLGIHIVRNVMDEVSYQRKIARNLVTLVKRIANKESE